MTEQQEDELRFQCYQKWVERRLARVTERVSRLRFQSEYRLSWKEEIEWGVLRDLMRDAYL